MRMSPWAKLMTRITPKMSVSPIPMRAYTPPMRMPLRRDCMKTAMAVQVSQGNLLPAGEGIHGLLGREFGRQDGLVVSPEDLLNEHRMAVLVVEPLVVDELHLAHHPVPLAGLQSVPHLGPVPAGGLGGLGHDQIGRASCSER